MICSTNALVYVGLDNPKHRIQVTLFRGGKEISLSYNYNKHFFYKLDFCMYGLFDIFLSVCCLGQSKAWMD